MTPQPIGASCLRDYMPAYHTSGTRPVSDITLIVLHDEEASTAQGAARYFQSPSSGGSAHLCVDDQACYRCLEDNQIPWGAPGATHQGFHIEQAGYARWSAVIWFSHARTLRRAAYKTAYHCKLFRIPPVFLAASELKKGARGITTHAECSKAFGGDHTDPGRAWPRRAFMVLVRNYYKKL